MKNKLQNIFTVLYFVYILYVLLHQQTKRSIMRNVKLTTEQALKVGIRKVGMTSGIRDKETGIRSTIRFCSSIDFVKAFGIDEPKEFIEI